MIVRSGVDLIEIARLDELQPRIRARFLARVYTPQELADCAGRSASLAARFAAKEAVAKALGCGIGAVRWQDIEVVREENGAPGLALHGAAKTEAARLGLETWSLSLSHSRSHAIAFVVAVGAREDLSRQ
jgi:holo-[acyl-carrier protein] synthase